MGQPYPGRGEYELKLHAVNARNRWRGVVRVDATRGNPEADAERVRVLVARLIAQAIIEGWDGDQGPDNPS